MSKNLILPVECDTIAKNYPRRNQSISTNKQREGEAENLHIGR